MDEKTLRSKLKTIEINDFRYFPETDSTNTRALEWIFDGAPEYGLVIAGSQTAGRGRAGRKWITTQDASIAMSLILHPTKEEQQHYGLFPLLGGLAVVHTMHSTLNIQNSQVKWPNDVLIDRKKIAGVLLETSWQGEQPLGLVIGIGVNVFPASILPPDIAQYPTTYISQHTTMRVDLYQIVIDILSQIQRLRKFLLSPRFLQSYISSMAFLGQHVVLENTKQFQTPCEEFCMGLMSMASYY